MQFNENEDIYYHSLYGQFVQLQRIYVRYAETPVSFSFTLIHEVGSHQLRIHR